MKDVLHRLVHLPTQELTSSEKKNSELQTQLSVSLSHEEAFPQASSKHGGKISGAGVDAIWLVVVAGSLVVVDVTAVVLVVTITSAVVVDCVTVVVVESSGSSVVISVVS